MRVLHLIATAQRRGAEVFASDLVHALGQTGTDQAVVVLDGTHAPAIGFDAPVAYLHGGAKGGWGAQPRTVVALRSVVRRWRPDVIQAHGGEPLMYASLAGGPPVVYRKIGGAHPRFRSGPLRPLYSWMLRRADAIIAVAEAMRREVTEQFRVPSSRVRTIPHAVDPQRIVPTRTREETREVLGVPVTSRVVTSLGALTWEKDPMAALGAPTPMLDARRDVVLLFAGDGPLRGRLRQEVHAKGLDGRVRLLGVREDVGDLLTATDVLLLSSRIEGLPGCIVEAGMLGVPAAAYAVAGVPEIVSDGETGVLAEPGDVAGLAGALRTIVDDRDLAQRLGATARIRCHERYRIDAVAPGYLATYEDVVGRPLTSIRRTGGRESQGGERMDEVPSKVRARGDGAA
jgi:glycosyltransferase involved in cell wall biosynthesis